MHSPDLQIKGNRDPYDPVIKRRLLIKVFHLSTLFTLLTLNLRENGHSQVELYFAKMPRYERLTLFRLIHFPLIHSITIVSHLKKKKPLLRYFRRETASQETQFMTSLFKMVFGPFANEEVRIDECTQKAYKYCFTGQGKRFQTRLTLSYMKPCVILDNPLGSSGKNFALKERIK